MGARAEAKFVVDLPDVALDRALRDEQAVADLAIGEALPRELQAAHGSTRVPRGSRIKSYLE